MTHSTVERTTPIAWGIWLSAHAGQPYEGMHVHSLQEQPLCLHAVTGKLVPYDALGVTGTEHSLFGVGDDQRAWVQNSCATLSCRVNGAEMRPGERWALADRDEITVGLARLSVLEADSPQQWDAWGGSRPGHVLDDEAAALEALRALNNIEMHTGAFSPEDRRHSRGGAAADVTPNETQDPLLSLATEFDQAILGTHQGLRPMHAAAPGLPSSTLPPPPDPFEDASDRPTTRMLLEGLLPEATDIDSILGDMNEFNESQLFAPTPNQDVLRLLAEQSAAHLPEKNIASLARREHHDLSIDSHFEQDLSESTH
ncbi:TagK domain-containing protein [Achromobacter seleniivolatilans]|uniref:TagK domain-containing protein n=1 Tax=Achromobacter seleniivolatilans TaxID=3047478 RepID=A0ABY9LZR6_9BURK|nr:TagK domain-containing protein [Achromobacter sp. R39]WMD20261.1 TagK domain-containing protein [Achromobacter sp. R39]